RHGEGSCCRRGGRGATGRDPAVDAEGEVPRGGILLSTRRAKCHGEEPCCRRGVGRTRLPPSGPPAPRPPAHPSPSRRQQDLSPTAPRTAPNRRQQDSSRSLACAVGNLPQVVVVVAIPRSRTGVVRACRPLRGRNRTRENVGDPTEPRPPAH